MTTITITDKALPKDVFSSWQELFTYLKSQGIDKKTYKQTQEFQDMERETYTSMSDALLSLRQDSQG